MAKLSPSDAIWAADEFINYYQNFNRIDDYFRMIKSDSISASVVRWAACDFINYD